MKKYAPNVPNVPISRIAPIVSITVLNALLLCLSAHIHAVWAGARMKF